MHYVVLAYPNIGVSDYKQIQTIRKANDRQFAMVEPHFTVVFPTSKPSQAEMLEHIESLCTKTKSFSFSLTKAVVEENTNPQCYQVHLVASKPVNEIVDLHDHLYTGVLSSELRDDIPFIPHITIASNDDKAAMQTLANDFNTNSLPINGKINAITLAAFDGKKVVDIKVFRSL